MSKAAPKVTSVNLETLQQDDLNANKGTARGSALLEQSLRDYKFGRPLLMDKNGVIMAGNKTYEQLTQMGIEDAIVIDTDGSKPIIHRRTDLDLTTDPEARELALADNRVAQLNLEYDALAIAKMRDEGVNVGKFFLDHELDALLRKVSAESPLPLTTGEGGGSPVFGVGGGAGEGEDGDPFTPASHVKMVQLFLNTDTFAQFETWVAALSKDYGTDNTTDTVMEALRRAYADREQ